MRDFPFKTPAAGLWGQEKVFALWVISHPVCDSCMRSDEVNTHIRCTVLGYMILQRCMLAFTCHVVNRLGCSLDWMEMRLEGEMCVFMSGSTLHQQMERSDILPAVANPTAVLSMLCEARSVNDWVLVNTEEAEPLCPSILNTNIDIRSAVLL